jgi:HPr kinase/phosphorylase
LPAAENIHATLVARGGAGVLLRGPSGAGKSDLALRLLGRGWQLVADDRVEIWRDGDAVFGTAPQPLRGLLELRGIGIQRTPFLAQSPITLVVDLTPREQIQRLPEQLFSEVAGVKIPNFRLHSFDASTPEKIELLLRRLDSV